MQKRALHSLFSVVSLLALVFALVKPTISLGFETSTEKQSLQITRAVAADFHTSYISLSNTNDNQEWLDELEEDELEEDADEDGDDHLITVLHQVSPVSIHVESSFFFLQKSWSVVTPNCFFTSTPKFILFHNLRR